MKFISGTFVGFALLAAIATAEPNAFPYDEFAKFTDKMPGEKVGDELLIAAYLKAKTPGEKLDAAQANFRIQFPDGKAVPLKCEILPADPAQSKLEADQKKIAAGFTHKLWIPKDPAKYAGAAMLNDLPKDFLEIQFPLPPKAE